MNLTGSRFRVQLFWILAGLSVLPSLLLACGADFSISEGTAEEFSRQLTPGEKSELQRAFASVRGPLTYTLLEWTAICIALLTSVFSMFHYLMRNDLATPVIGAALLFSGMIDVFYTLAIVDIIPSLADPRDFVPFTWFVSRTFHVSITIAGVSPFLSLDPIRPSHSPRGVLFLLGAGLLVCGAAYSIIWVCATVPDLPRSLYPNSWIHRPWDAIPLAMYLLAGGVFLPKFHRLHPSLFSHGLLLSVIPLTVAQLHLVFGSAELYDSHFYVASCLKILGFLIPLSGLIVDYSRAYRAEAALLATQEKLKVARSVQENLLPDCAPQMNCFELAGFSYPANAVGGDYFDYIPMHQSDSWGVVIADVSGHEIGSAILMSQTRAYLRSMGTYHHSAPEILKQLNQFLCKEVRENRFVCMVLILLNPGSRSCLVSTIGHEAYVVQADGTFRTLESQCPPLGILPDAEFPAPLEVPHHAGNVIVLPTDGILETTGPDGEAFGLQRTLELVKSHRDLSASEILDRLKQGLNVFSNQSPQVDDVTAVIIKSLPAPASAGKRKPSRGRKS